MPQPEQPRPPCSRAPCRAARAPDGAVALAAGQIGEVLDEDGVVGVGGAKHAEGGRGVRAAGPVKGELGERQRQPVEVDLRYLEVGGGRALETAVDRQTGES